MSKNDEDMGKFLITQNAWNQLNNENPELNQPPLQMPEKSCQNFNKIIKKNKILDVIDEMKLLNTVKANNTDKCLNEIKNLNKCFSFNKSTSLNCQYDIIARKWKGYISMVYFNYCCIYKDEINITSLDEFDKLMDESYNELTRSKYGNNCNVVNKVDSNHI
ncbi:hypothetical protein A3Q56_07220, partial [Intoshia linei]